MQVTGNKVSITPGNVIPGFNLNIPGDISSAAFYIVGAVISKGSEIILKDVGVNPTRLGFIHILRLMGADIALLNQRENSGEAIADIKVCYSPLQGINISDEYVSIAIDEFPVLFVAASCASGETQITGLGELRHKESDRISAMVDGLRELGINIEEQTEGVVIQGGQIQGGKVDSRGDHRIAMAFSIAALVSSTEISISNCAQVATSFPEFVEKSARAGIRIRKEEANVST